MRNYLSMITSYKEMKFWGSIAISFQSGPVNHSRLRALALGYWIGSDKELKPWQKTRVETKMRMLKSKSRSRSRVLPYCTLKRSHKRTLQTHQWLRLISIQILSVLQVCLSLPGPSDNKQICHRSNSKSRVQLWGLDSDSIANKPKRETG